jgi:DNA-directed RNA polymerase subunit RPC12/RpoP
MEPKPKVAKKERNEHGTQVARAITCASCGAKDTIRFAPKDPKRALCRKCAVNQLGVQDPDSKLGDKISYTCAQCKRTLLTDDPNAAKYTDYVCNDCMRGIESKQENKTKDAARISKKVLRVRKPG